MLQQTLVLLKPDTVKRSLVGTCISRFEAKEMKIVGMKLFRMDQALCASHYSPLASKPFFPEIVEYMTSGPIVALAVEGEEAVAVVREMCGATDPVAALPGTIRGDLAPSIRYNMIHSSDSLDTAKAELARFFQASELIG